MQIEKPFFKVFIKTLGIKYRVVVNGVAIKTDATLRPVKVEIPINQFVRSGDNSVELKLFPLSKKGNLASNEHAYAELEFRLYTDLNEHVVLSKIQFSELNLRNGDAVKGSTEAQQFFIKNKQLIIDKSGDYRRSALAYTVYKDQYNKTLITQTVTMQTPFAEWAFLSSDAIVDHRQFKTVEAMVEGLVGEPFKLLEKIHAALSKKDIDNLMPLFKERNEEMDKAYYYQPGTYESFLKEQFVNDLADEGMVLEDLELQYAKPVISPGRQLMELGSSPLIYFAKKEAALYNYYGIVFRQQGKDWIITR